MPQTNTLSLDRALDDARSARQHLTWAALTPLISLIALAVIYLALVFLLLWAANAARDSEDVSAVAQEIESLMIDMETSLRGYALRRDDRFLPPYEAAITQIDPLLDELLDRTQDEPQQAELSAEVAEVSKVWREQSAKYLEGMRQGQMPDLADALEAKGRMDIIRRDLRQIMINQRGEVADRDALVRVIIGFTVIGGVGLSGLLGYLLLRRWRQGLRDTAARYTQIIRTNHKQGRELADALQQLDKEMQIVARIQRSLLPKRLPDITGMELDAFYAPSTHVGGDYYDFFPLHHIDADGQCTEGEERWGMLIADVSGHGTPAAVMMAVTHVIAHGYEQPPSPSSHLLNFVNKRLCRGYTGDAGVAFVTAFYAIYTPATGIFEYSSAGHNPPRLRRDATGDIEELDQAVGLPLGIDDGVDYPSEKIKLEPGDLLVMYTDGITESRDPQDDFFDTERLDETIGTAEGTPAQLVSRLMSNVRTHAKGRPADDDQTLIIARVFEPAEGVDSCGNLLTAAAADEG